MSKFNKLSKAEMKNVLGGAVTMQHYDCQCISQTGTYNGSFSSQNAAEASGSAYCKNGATCKAAAQP